MTDDLFRLFGKPTPQVDTTLFIPADRQKMLAYQAANGLAAETIAETIQLVALAFRRHVDERIVTAHRESTEAAAAEVVRVRETVIQTSTDMSPDQLRDLTRWCDMLQARLRALMSTERPREDGNA